MFNISYKTFKKHKKMIICVTCLILILCVYIVYKKYVSSISREDEKYMRNFVIYRDKLFEIYGILSIIKLMYTNYENNYLFISCNYRNEYR